VLIDRTRRDDTGITIIEVTVVMMILAIVAVILFTALASLTESEARTQKMVDNEQQVRFVVDQVLRDLREANPLSGMSYADENAYTSALQLATGDTTKTYVRWVYDNTSSSPTYRTLRRQILSADTETATVLSSTIKLRNVQNSELFEYFSQSGNDLVSGSYPAADIGNCAIRVRVTVTADPASGPKPITVKAEAHLRNRLPGGLGCG
jgi:type II secretory pathway pseudopilin PulG